MNTVWSNSARVSLIFVQKKKVHLYFYTYWGSFYSLFVSHDVFPLSYSVHYIYMHTDNSATLPPLTYFRSALSESTRPLVSSGGSSDFQLVC